MNSIVDRYNRNVVAAHLAYYPDGHLFKRTKAITDFTGIRTIAEMMFDTMALNNGMGLAANQIKLDMRMFVMATSTLRQAFVNPRIQTLPGAKKKSSEERCLSFPGVEVVVERYPECIIHYQDLNGDQQLMTLDGIDAICAQHEIEHLDGKTFVDQLGGVRRMMIKNTVQKEAKKCRQKNKRPTSL